MKESLIHQAKNWIGKLPETWKLVPLKYLCSYNDQILREDTPPSFKFNYIDIGSVSYENGIGITELMTFDTSPSRARRVVQPNDIIVSTVRTYLKAIARIPEFKTPMIASTGFLVIRANQKVIIPEFLYYVLRADFFISAIEAESVGVSYPAINASEAVKNYVPLPPLEQQKKIVSYLNHFDQKIEDSIKRHQAIIEKLEKYKVSVIRQAVTKGLNSNVNLGKTNIAWVNSIPNHWSIDKVSRIFKTIGSGTTPDTKSNQFYGGDIPWIQSGDLSQWLLTNTDQKIKSLALESVSSLKMYKAPFIVIAMYGASIGNISISQIDACTNQACCVLKDSIGFDKYFAYCLYAAKDHLIFSADGSTQPNISQKKIKQIWLPIPPLDEQIRICEYLEKILLDVRTSIERYLEIISYLRTYQRSVIYQAVTGKIDLKENPL